MTDQVQSDQVGTGQTGPEYTGGERLGTEQSGTEQSGTAHAGSDQAGADRQTTIDSPDRSGSTTSDRGSQEAAPAQDSLQAEQSGHVAQAAEESRAAEEVRGDDQTGGDPESTGSESARETEEDTGRSDEERQRAAEDFAREHDPEQHDVSAGEEFRQPGDWTADDAGGAQVWDSEGTLVEGSAPGATTNTNDQSDQSSNTQSAGTDRRTSELDEVRDGGYGVGSAAPLDDGALPLGHPVKAWEDTKTFVTPDHEKYDEADPHVWYTDADAAQQAGFRPID